MSYSLFVFTRRLGYPTLLTVAGRTFAPFLICRDGPSWNPLARLWTPMDAYGYPLISLGIFGYLWISLDMNAVSKTRSGLSQDPLLHPSSSSEISLSGTSHGSSHLHPANGRMHESPSSLTTPNPSFPASFNVLNHANLTR